MIPKTSKIYSSSHQWILSNTGEYLQWILVFLLVCALPVFSILSLSKKNRNFPPTSVCLLLLGLFCQHAPKYLNLFGSRNTRQQKKSKQKLPRHWTTKSWGGFVETSPHSTSPQKKHMFCYISFMFFRSIIIRHKTLNQFWGFVRRVFQWLAQGKTSDWPWCTKRLQPIASRPVSGTSTQATGGGFFGGLGEREVGWAG